MAVVLRTRKTYPGFGFWTAGIACLALGAALLIPDVLPSNWAARMSRNGLLLAGHVLILRGMLLFRGMRVGWALEALIALAFLLPFAYFSLDGRQLAARIVYYCLCSGALSLATVTITLRRRPPHFGSNDVLLALWLTLFALISFVRAAQELANISTAFETIKGFGGIYALAQILSVQLVTLTLISMNSQRIEAELRASARQLQASEQQLRSMGDNLPAGFIYRYEVVDGCRRFDHVSGGIEATVGLQAADVMTDAELLFALMTPEVRARYVEGEARSAAALSDFHGTLRFERTDGQPRWLDVHSRPQHRADGSTFWDGVALDVTQRRRAEERALRQARFYLCLSQCNAAVARCDSPTTLFDAICRAIIDVAGMRLAWVSLVDEAGDVVAQAHAQADAAADVPDHTRPGGGQRLNLRADQAPARGLLGPTGVAMRSGEPVWCQDFQSDPLTRPWHEQAPESGFQAAAALPVRRATAVVGALTICAGEAQAFDEETQRLLVDLAANISFALDNLDREAARRQAQQALDAHRLQLEDTVERRTRQLAEASQRAEAASLAKSAFLANMSHEIRTPLNAMIGMAHLIRREGLSPRQADRLFKLEAAARHLLDVLNAVLDLSKIEAGKMALEAVPLSVESTVANVLSMLDDRAEAKQLRLSSQVDPMARNLVGDPTRLQQALLNYASNAIKFTRQQGSVSIRALVAEQDEASALLRFEVQDTGIGIAADVLPTLFEAFEQADASTTRQAGGTGLGLAITRRLAAMMGGEAGATSRPGTGSTFWFTARLRRALPMMTGDGPPGLDNNKSAEHALRRRHTGTRVLLAEDNVINAEVALALLENVGLVVDLAEDGATAVDMALARDYRLVLMDMQMPRLDGLDASRALRLRHSSSAMPIIAMTANAFAEDKARCQAAGMDDFVSKPVDPQALYRMLLHWLDRSPAGAEVTQH
jgi:PAS domain S-box-containing protein